MPSVSCGKCGAPTGDRLPLCRTCLAALIGELRAVPGIVADLLVTLARQDRVTVRLASPSTQTPLPLRLHASRALDELGNTVTTWARALCEDHHVSLATPVVAAAVRRARDGHRPDPAALAAVAPTSAEIAALWLAAHPHWIRRLPDPVEARNDIVDAITRARRAMDRMPELRYRGPCRVCAADLYAEAAATTIVCTSCDTSFNATDVREFLLSQVENQLATSRQIVAVVRELTGKPLPFGTLRAWRSRGQLVPRAWQHNGRVSAHWIHRDDPPLFRLGDALDLLSRANQASKRKQAHALKGRP